MRPIDRFLTLAGAEVAARRQPGQRRPPGCAWRSWWKRLPNRPVGGRLRRLAVCGHLSAACAEMRPELAAAFQALEPELSWQTRVAVNGSTGFAEGHAGSRVLDRTGLEQRGGLVAGFSLVAPGVTYPEHDHPPEEIYLVLSGGMGRGVARAWSRRDRAQPAGIRHAMRGTSVPRLGIWFLLPG